MFIKGVVVGKMHLYTRYLMTTYASLIHFIHIQGCFKYTYLITSVEMLYLVPLWSKKSHARKTSSQFQSLRFK